MKTFLLDSNETPVLGYIMGYGIGILLIIIITRAVFSIPRIVRELHAHTLLLAKIAENQGVDRDWIMKVIAKAETGTSEKSLTQLQKNIPS
jgi:ABC-type lipoprotein release transport system permease subunit